MSRCLTVSCRMLFFAGISCNGPLNFLVELLFLKSFYFSVGFTSGSFQRLHRAALTLFFLFSFSFSLSHCLFPPIVSCFMSLLALHTFHLLSSPPFCLFNPSRWKWLCIFSTEIQIILKESPNKWQIDMHTNSPGYKSSMLKSRA